MARKKSETAVLGFRVKEPLRNQIEKAAKSNGVSMNAELVRRVETSFNNENSDAAAYGGAELSALFRMLAAAANFIEARTGESCTADYLTNVAVRVAWKKLLDETELPIPEEIRADKAAKKSTYAAVSDVLTQEQREIDAYRSWQEACQALSQKISKTAVKKSEKKQIVGHQK